ncbi:hypothetical protein Tco_1276838 [Tanacetum coccineum]
MADLNADEQKQIKCDIMAANIVLQGLPNDIHTLLNNKKTANSIWNRKGETIQSYYLRSAKLLNNIIINGIEMNKLQINTKFLNHLQLKWKRYVTMVKQSKDLYTVSYDQMFAYLKQNHDEENEIQAERAARTHDLLALVAQTCNASTLYTNPAPQYNQKMSYAPQQQYAPQLSHVTQICASNNGKTKATGIDVIENVGDYVGAYVIDQTS